MERLPSTWIRAMRKRIMPYPSLLALNVANLKPILDVPIRHKWLYCIPSVLPCLSLSFSLSDASKKIKRKEEILYASHHSSSFEMWKNLRTPYFIYRSCSFFLVSSICLSHTRFPWLGNICMQHVNCHSFCIIFVFWFLYYFGHHWGTYLICVRGGSWWLNMRVFIPFVVILFCGKEC